MNKFFLISIYFLFILFFYIQTNSTLISLTFLVISIFLHILFYKLSFFGNLDTPNERSMHRIPTKKSAGIIFIPLFIFFSAFYEYILNQRIIHLNFFILLFSLSVLGYIDDKKNLSFQLKLFVEFIFFALFYYFNFQNLNLLLVCLLICLAIYFINIVNFMDGIDSYLATFTNLFLSIFLFWRNDFLFNLDLGYFFLISFFGFSLFNIPKARLFMGDSGSLAVGFFLFHSNFLFSNETLPKNQIPFLLIPFIGLSVYILDSSLTILIRFLNKKNIFQAHKEHLYQKLSSKLNSSIKVVFLFGAFQFLIIYLSKFYINQMILFLGIVFFIEALIYFYIQKKIS